MRYVRGFLLLGLAWFAAGCMQFEYGITLEDDLSGTADVDIAIDLDRVAYMGAYLENSFSGEGGEPTAEQIQESREQILQEMDEDEDFSEESLRAEIEPDLPDGVTLLSAKVDRDELLTTMNVRFAFDHVDQLKDIHLDDEDQADGGPAVSTDPFENLQITQQGDEIVIRSEPINPMDEMDDQPWLSDELVDKLLEGFSVTFKITSPFDVEEHNATRREGKTLVWVFNLETLRSGEANGIYARLKR